MCRAKYPRSMYSLSRYCPRPLTEVEATIKKYAPKFIYTMPNYHNPTGILMSLEKRQRLLELAGRYCIPIIEEDSQRDFR